MLYFIGLGLGDAKDITVRGLEIVKRCEKVFLEHYTSILTVGQEELEKFYEREVNVKFGKRLYEGDPLCKGDPGRQRPCGTGSRRDP